MYQPCLEGVVLEKGVNLEKSLMETNDIVTFDEFPFHIRTEKLGDISVIKEVFLYDCYRLRTKTYKPEVIFDVGGHLGSFSCLAKSLWPDVKIVLVEPNPRSLELARLNLERFGNVEFIAGAMKYDQNANVFVDNVRATGSGLMMSMETYEQNLDAIKRIGSPYYIHTRDVASYTIEQLMDEFKIGRIDILKMDCEGGEKDFFLHVNSDIAIHHIRDFCGEYHYDIGGFYLDARSKFPHHKISFFGDNRDIGMFWGETDTTPFIKFRKRRLSIKSKPRKMTG